MCFLGSKENSPEGEEEENLCAEPSLEHVFFFFSLDGLVTLWLSRARVCLEAVTKPRDRDEISFVESRPETVSLDGQRIDKDYEIRFAVKENWLWVFLFLFLSGLISLNQLWLTLTRDRKDKDTWPSLRAS